MIRWSRKSHAYECLSRPGISIRKNIRHTIEPLEPRLLLSGSISAAFVEVATPVEMDGYRTFDLQVTTDEDWSFGSLLIELNQGSIYQDDAGTDLSPNPTLFGSYPTLEYDTYITANGHSLSVLDGAREIGGDDLQFDTQQIDITWFDLAKDDTGTFVIARVTVTDDASGFLAMGMLGGGEDYDVWTTFSGGDLTDLTQAQQRDPTPMPPAPEPTVPVDNSVRVVEVDNSAVLTGYTTYDIVLSTEGDWRIAGMLIELDTGHIYQDAMGTNLAPNSLMFTAYPTLEFDSYVTTNGNPTSVVGFAGDLGGSQLQFDDSRIDIVWFDVQKDDVGVFKIARVTLSNNASGHFGLLTYYGDYEHHKSYDFHSGQLRTSAPPAPPPPAPMVAEFVEVKNSQSLSGYKTFDLVVDSETDWTNASLQLDLSEGVIYQDAAGTNLAPNPTTFGSFASLQYDTYVTANGRITSIAGDGDSDSSEAEQFDTSSLDITWSGPADNDTGKLVLGRITVSEDAVGSLNLRVSSEDNELADTGFFIFGNLDRMTSTYTPVPAAAADFTLDGKADLLWLNMQNGQLSLWEMNRTAFTGSTEFEVDLGPDWYAVATGDFNGDTAADVLWRNQRNGRNIITELDGTEVTSKTYIKRLRSRNWEVGGIADFTGDGQADILWRNMRNGKNSVWEMDGTTFVSATAIKALNNRKWMIAGATDFTADGQADILWRNVKNGRNMVWEMDGTAVTQSTAIRGVQSQNMQIAAVGDYTGDGQADIVWRNMKNGSNSVWQMEGTDYFNNIAIGKQSNQSWQPAGSMLGLWEDANTNNYSRIVGRASTYSR